jgi:LmbE family N-acetylglucosaminyl deacetylase
MRLIYLSPHLDDAVLSAGGLIRSQSEAGVPVEIWTLMAGIAVDENPPEFAQAMHRVWGFESSREAVEARRREDERTAAKVGAKPVHFEFLDCIYRRGRMGQPLYSVVESPIDPEEADLPPRISQAMAAGLRVDDMVICQLAIGGHVDHVIVRQAAEMLQRPLIYDADMPYLLNHPDELEPSVFGLREAMQPIPEAAFRCWISAIECYASQVDAVFGSRDEMLRRMEEFWSDQRGIRFWARPSAD